MKIIAPLKERTDDWCGSIPAPELKSGKRPFRLCNHTFKSFFDVPFGAKDVRLIITDRPHPDAYELTLEERTYQYTSYKYKALVLDGFHIGAMYDNASNVAKRLLKEGKVYIRVDYKEAE